MNVDAALLQQILAYLPDSVTIQDRNFRIIYQNEAFRKISGDAVGKECFRVYEGREQVCDDCGLQKVFAAGKPTLALRSVAEKDGTFSRWENSCYPLFSAAGEIVAGVEVCRNITERFLLEKQAKEHNRELTRLNQEYSSLLEHLPDCIVRYDPELRRTYVNPAWEQAAGLSSGQVDGRSPAEMSERLRPLNENYREKLLEAFASGLSQTCAFEWENARGEKLYLDNEIIPECDEAGKTVSVLAVGRNLTERKWAEDALKHERSLLRCIIDSASDLIFVKDRKSTYLACNKASEIFLGRPESEQIGKSDFDFFDREMAERVRNNDRKVIEQGVPQQSEEWVNYADGRRVLLDTLKVPFYGPDGSIQGLVGICRDITERKRALDALHVQQGQAQSLLRLSKRLESAQSYPEVIAVAHAEVQRVVGYTNLWVYLLSEDGQYFDVLVADGSVSANILGEAKIARLTIAGDPMLKEIATAKDLVIVEDARLDPRTDKEIVARLGNRTIINVPILLSDQHLGSLGTGTFGAEGVKVPTRADQDYLAAVASHMAVTLDRVRLLNERIQTEATLRQLNRKLRAISDCNRVLLRAENEQDLLKEICRIVCEKAGYLLAWVGIPEADAEQSIRPVAWAGKESDYVVDIRISWSEKSERGRGPAGLAIGSGQTVQIQDIATDERMGPWRESALKRGYRASMALPLKDNASRIFGVLMVYDGTPNGITPDEVELLEGLAANLAYGIMALRNRELRLQAEQAYLEQQQLLLETQQMAHIGNWWHDLESGEIYWSDEFFRILGVEPQAPREELAAKLIHPDDLPILQQAMAASAAGEREQEHDFRVLRADGELRWVHNHWLRIEDDNGREIKRIGTHQDITVKKLAAEALAAREREFRTLAENSPDNIARYDVNGRTVYANSTLAMTLGCPAAEMLGKTPVELGKIHEASDYQKKISEILASGEATEMDLVLPGSGNGVRYHNVRFVAERRGDGAITGVLAIGRDVTDRIRTEEVRKSNLRFFESMDRVNRAIQGATDPEHMMSAVLDAVLEIFSCDRASLIYPCDPDAATWRVPMERYRPAYPGLFALGSDLPMTPEIAAMHRASLIDNRPLLFGAGTDFPIPEQVKEFGDQSGMGMAIHPKTGSPWGFSLIQCSCPRVWTAEEIQLFEAIGRRVADGLTSLLSYRELSDSREFLDSIVENLPSMLCVKDARTLNFVRFNRAGEQLLGYSRAELLGRNDYDFFPAEMADFFTANDRLVLGSKEALDIPQEKIRLKDQSERILHTQKIPLLNKRGEPQYLLGISEDITEFLMAEEELRKLTQAIEQSPVSIVITDANGHIEFVNRKFSEITGYSAIEAAGQNPRVLKSGETSAEEYRQLWQTISAGRIWSGEFHNKKMNGELFWEHATIAPVRNAEQRITHYVAVKEDITERKRLEEQLFQAQKLESVGQLAGGVAHDFNNMLAVIIGRSEMALRKLDPAQNPALFDSLREILTAAERSADLTRQLLTFARKQVIAPRQILLNDALEAMLKMLRRLIGENIDLAWLPGNDQLQIKIDPVQLDQILVNLCVNARDAIDERGKITIETHAVVFDRRYSSEHSECIPGEYVLLAVSDNGQGMDKLTLERIFEPFYTTKRIGQGTGLGLATIYGIVKQNNGFINVYSEPGRGTTFKIYLPRITAFVPDESATEEVKPLVKGHETILLVEDEPSILGMAQQMLEDCGYQILSATTPEEALRLVKEFSGEIHLLLTDVVMPGMNGHELAALVCSRHPQIRCLFMSGYTANIIARHGVLEEGVDFIQKPFALEALTFKVRAILDRPPRADIHEN